MVALFDTKLIKIYICLFLSSNLNFSGRILNPYNPDVAHHIINQPSNLLLRTHSALECEANESVHWRTF